MQGANARRPLEDCRGRRRKGLRMALLKTRRSSRARRREGGDHPKREPRRTTAQRPSGQPPIIELERRDQGLPGRPHGARPGHAGDRPRRVRLPRRSDRLRQVDPDQDPDPRASSTTEGSVRIAGSDIGALPEKKIPQLRRNIGTVFQDFKLLPDRTVYDNVAYALQVIGATAVEIRRQVPEILRLVGLSTKLHSYPDELSGGEQQRVSIARAFVNHPPLLLADEPSGNLDPVTSIGIMQLLYRINKTGTTVLVVTHDREMVDNMRRRVIELYEGRVVRDEDAAATPRSRRPNSACGCGRRWASATRAAAAANLEGR